MASTTERGIAGVGSLVLAATRRFSERIAFDLDGSEVRYEALGLTIHRAVGHLAALGLEAGAPVAQLTGNLVEAFALQMASFLTGHPSVMLHPKIGAGDQRSILSDARPGVVVVDPSLSIAEELTESLPLGAHAIFSHGPHGPHRDFWSLPTAYQGISEPDCRDVARIAYTGGTTGHPKGVLLSQGAMLASTLLASCEMEWPRHPRFMVSTPITHAGGTLIPTVLMRGGTVCLRKRFDPDQLIDEVGSGRANSGFLVPTMMYGVMDRVVDRGKPVRGLELLLYGASAIAPNRLHDALEVFGDVLNQSYGQTEAPNTVTILKASEHRGALLASSGMAYAGVTVTIRDGDGQEQPPESVGEVCVRGPQLMNGYNGLPELSARTLRDGVLYTGDLARMDERGYLFHVGRSKDVIITGGVNVYPSEVEEVLGSHDDVAMSVVVGVPDDVWGESVKALVVTREGKVTEEELKALVRATKGPVHVPKSLEVVDSLPLTALGKPDREQVKAGFWADKERMVN
ncbi:MAG TPA: AMP-binding protein [Acidimicrobiales bacterium]|jgi:fatty-acyl-CoA synthase|nr:AMP-binding protein [Acidimicrobiales bacterium]